MPGHALVRAGAGRTAMRPHTRGGALSCCCAAMAGRPGDAVCSRRPAQSRVLRFLGEFGRAWPAGSPVNLALPPAAEQARSRCTSRSSAPRQCVQVPARSAALLLADTAAVAQQRCWCPAGTGGCSSRRWRPPYSMQQITPGIGSAVGLLGSLDGGLVWHDLIGRSPWSGHHMAFTVQRPSGIRCLLARCSCPASLAPRHSIN